MQKIGVPSPMIIMILRMAILNLLNVVNNTTFNTTQNNLLDIQAKFSTTNANNQIYSDIFVLNKIY